MARRSIVVIALNIVLVVLAFWTNSYGIDHFADGGCDGGTCSLLLFFYSVPLMLGWLFHIIAFNVSIAKKWGTFIFLILGLVLTTFLFTEGYGILLKELYLGPKLQYGVAALSILLYFFGDRIGIRDVSHD